MARYTHLTIFQKTFDLLVRIFKEIHKFPKEYKYSLGNQMHEACLQLMDQIIFANSEENKKPALKKANTHLNRLLVYIRLCYALKIIGAKKYEVLSKYTEEVGRMLGGWLKSSR